MDWYYAEGGQQKGPVNEQTAADLIHEGQIARTTLVWRSGMPDWAAAGVTDLSRYFGASEESRPPVEAPSMRSYGAGSAPGQGSFGAPENPYGPPSHDAGQLAPLPMTGAGNIPRREIAIVALLSVVTFGIYVIYLLYRWAKEINTIHGEEKHNPVLVLVLTIVTCSLAGLVFEILFAFDLEKSGEQAGLPGRRAGLGMLVLGLNIGSLVINLVAGGAFFFVAWIAGIAAICFVQAELNKFADRAAQAQSPGLASYR